MKNLRFKLLVFIGMLTIGNKVFAETLMTNYYNIVSDKFVDSIPEGKCLLRGKVYEAYSQQSVTGGYLSPINSELYTNTNTLGEYELLVPDTDSTLYFYHESYGEIVCWGYDFKSQHVVEIDFITERRNPEGTYDIREKPVIYLYAKKETAVSLSLLPKGKLTFTYPQYNNGWNVNVMEDGSLVVDNQSYPYLFWESESDKLDFIVENGAVEGFYIHTDTTVQFLEHQLTAMGLNSTEKTDFITYWAPRLMATPYAIVQFLIDDTYDREIATLTMKPAPDQQRRVFILFQNLENNEPPNFLVEPAKPKPFVRQGLVLVEWGGTQMN